jgi:transposase
MLLLLWQEYRVEHTKGYDDSWFYDLYAEWCGGVSLTMRQTHVAGERLFVDFAGQTLAVIDPATGGVQPAQVFVAVLGASTAWPMQTPAGARAWRTGWLSPQRLRLLWHRGSWSAATSRPGRSRPRRAGRPFRWSWWWRCRVLLGSVAHRAEHPDGVANPGAVMPCCPCRGPLASDSEISLALREPRACRVLPKAE